MFINHRGAWRHEKVGRAEEVRGGVTWGGEVEDAKRNVKVGQYRRGEAESCDWALRPLRA
jgi:hypothetical protein